MPSDLATNLDKIVKAYDIRGVYPTELDENTAYRLAKAYATWLKPKKVVLGRDVRNSGESLFEEAKRGLTEMGIDVVDVGVITSDMLLFAVANYGFDGGISITASHNPPEYNGMKVVRGKAVPVSIDSGLAEIREIAKNGEFAVPERVGEVEKLSILDDYIKKVLSFVDIEKIKPLKVVVNPNFGAAGRVIDRLADQLSLNLIKINFEPDGSFPKGKPDPSSPENRVETIELVKSSGADLGVIWDADADRCLFIDETGERLQGSYTSAILAETIIRKNPGGKAVTDTSIIWPFISAVKEAGGTPIVNKVGHSFITERMIQEGAVFGGETSGHFYFKDYYFCDNGMIPFLLILEKLSTSGKKLSDFANPLREGFPNATDINFKVRDTKEKIAEVEEKYKDGKVEHIDGVSVEYPDWRFNVRASNTEPLLRLNLEAKTQELVDEKVRELTGIIKK